MQGLLNVVQRHGQLPDFGPCQSCTHYKPEACDETGGVGCQCGVSGDLLKPFRGRQNLRGFFADEADAAQIVVRQRPLASHWEREEAAGPRQRRQDEQSD